MCPFCCCSSESLFTHISIPARTSVKRGVVNSRQDYNTRHQKFIGVLGFVANAVVLAVLFSSKKSNSGTVNIFITNQTILDLLACFLLTVGVVIKLCGVTKFSRLTCLVIGGGTTVLLAINASIMSLVIITLERYVKIVHPIYHRNYFRRWMTHVGVALCWIDGISTCIMSDFVSGSNCLSIPLYVGRVGNFRFV